MPQGMVAERGVIQLCVCIAVACGGANALKQRSGSADKEFTVKPGREPSGGVITSENDDMSSDKECERHSRRKSKGSCLKLI